MQAWIKLIFSHVSMSVKFFHILCYRCTWYFLAKPQPSKLVCTQRLHISCVFSCRINTAWFRCPWPYEDGFSKVKNGYIKIAYYSICDDYGVNSNETWMYSDWFYTTHYAIFTWELKATKMSLPDNLTQWIITQATGFTRKGTEKISRSVTAYVYLVLTSQVQAR